MRYLLFAFLPMLQACSMLQKSSDEGDKAIQVTVQKEAINKESNVKVNVDVVNKNFHEK